MRPRRRVPPLVVALVITAGARGAAAGMTDADAKTFMNAVGCNGCHAIDESRIGPRLRDVARRYRAEGEDALPRLVAKIRNGGAGAWGLVPMIANPRVSAEDARDIAAWILALPDAAP